MWKVGETWNDIVYHVAKKRLARYRAGEKLDDFFQALMEDKSGNAHNSEWGEIVAEVSISMYIFVLPIVVFPLHPLLIPSRRPDTADYYC